jgi:hypothetical protein
MILIITIKVCYEIFKKIFALGFISVSCLNAGDSSDQDFVDTLTKDRIIGKLIRGASLSVYEKNFYSTQMAPVKPQEKPLARSAGKKTFEFK